MFQLENCIVAKIQGLYIRVEKMWNIFQSSFSAVDRLVAAAALGGTHPQHWGLQDTQTQQGENVSRNHLGTFINNIIILSSYFIVTMH